MKSHVSSVYVLLLSAASLLMLAGCGKKSNNDAREGFTMTITGKVFSSNITAQSLTIDWGDGTSETFAPCNKRSIKHTYKKSESHTVTAIAENLTYLDCSGNQLTGLDVSKSPKLKTLSCGNNELSAKAINAIFNALPKNLCGRIDLAGNPGKDNACDAFLAERKGWRVFFYENYGGLEGELIAREEALNRQFRSPDFQDFIKKFFINKGDYQLSHIQFPLPSNASDVDLKREDWCSIGWGHVLDGEIEVGNITYRGTFEEYYGVRYIYNFYNGDRLIYVLTFENIEGKWLLIDFQLGEN